MPLARRPEAEGYKGISEELESRLNIRVGVDCGRDKINITPQKKSPHSLLQRMC